jgi:hypothetical protein
VTAGSDCCVLTCWAGSQGRCADYSIKYAGDSRSGLPVSTEVAGEWRCLGVKKLSEVGFHADRWHTEPRSPRQTCVGEVDLDIDDQPGEEPQ